MAEDVKIFPNIPGYIPVKQAAEIMGVSRRRINDFVRAGRIRAFRAGYILMLLEEDVRKFPRKETGRPRTRLPIWRLPVRKNLQYLSVIFASIKPGQSENFDKRLKEIHAGQKHLLPGTVARYFSRSKEKPDDVQIVLIWRSTVMPSEEECKAEVEELKADLADILDWEKSWGEYGQVVMHT
ncbi:MAG TPA: helix-turn-helix domain-containing protein [Ktedonobacteraceae bacterium]